MKNTSFIKVHKNVSLPKSGRHVKGIKHSSHFIYPWDEMHPGDCFYVPASADFSITSYVRTRVSAAIRQRSKKYNESYETRFVIVGGGNPCIGVWRIK